MNTTTQLFAALAVALATSGAAMAQEATIWTTKASSSSLTRAEVMADVLQARADGSLDEIDSRQGLSQDSETSLSRQAVAANARRALMSGEVDLINLPAYNRAMARQIASQRRVAKGE